jgi:hypothetical protein
LRLLGALLLLGLSLLGGLSLLFRLALVFALLLMLRACRNRGPKNQAQKCGGDDSNWLHLAALLPC